MKTIDYLDAVKRRLKIASMYALAKHLEISEQAVAQLVAGNHAMSATTAAKVAEILGLEPLQVIADVEYERAKTERDRVLWKRVRESAAVALMAIGAASLAAPQPAYAVPLKRGVLHNYFSPSGAPNMHCRPWRRLRNWYGAIVALFIAAMYP